MQPELQKCIDALKDSLKGRKGKITVGIKPVCVDANADDMHIATGDYKSVLLAADLLKREMSDTDIEVAQEYPAWQLYVKGEGIGPNNLKEMLIPIELAKVVEIRLVCEISNPKFQNAYKQLKERLSKFKGVDMSKDTIRYSEDDPERNAIEEAIRKLPEELGWI